MTKKELNKYNIVQEIHKELFGLKAPYRNKFNFDISYNGDQVIDITQTSGNLDFKISTYQSRSENVYFNVSLYDYNTNKEINAGYFYIKNYTGEIGPEELQALALIIEAANQITATIFELIA